MRALRTALCAVLAALFAAGAAANDSTASLDTGALVLIPNDAVRMLEEELYLSPDTVEVRYVYEATGATAVTALVAFPLPPIEYGWDASYPFAARDPENPVDFRLWIDGYPTAYRTDLRAVNAAGADITEILRRWDIPPVITAPDPASYDRLRDRLDALPARAIAELAAAGAVDDLGDGRFIDIWTVHLAHYWEMRFPPGRRVEVRHAYKAMPMQTFFSSTDLELRTWHDEACIDTGFERAAGRMLAEAPGGTLGLMLLRYVLTTANNWRGPIGRFRLIVDKGSTEALVSLCRSGIVKTGPTTFEWEAQGFRPERDLTILFLRPLEGG